MPEHYPRNVTSVLHYCPTCNRKTMHRVDDRRLGSCMEQHQDGMSKSQQKRQEEREQSDSQPQLF